MICTNDLNNILFHFIKNVFRVPKMFLMVWKDMEKHKNVVLMTFYVSNYVKWMHRDNNTITKKCLKC